MNRKIIITGATGLIGKKIFGILNDKNYDIIVFTRNPEKAQSLIPNAAEYVKWNPLSIDTWKNHLENSHAVIHLAGESVMAKRWNGNQKNKILNSRLIGTRSLVNAINNVKVKPKTFISASAIGYYGFKSNKLLDESSNPGNDFLSIVTQKWEKEASDVVRLGVRWISVRIGIVLDRDEGALAKMIVPFKFFVGGRLGSGKQGFSWIHIEDLANLFVYSLENENVQGPINGTSPNPLMMKEFCSALGKVMNRPSFFKVPAFMAKLILGEASEIVLNSSFVMPKKTLESGFIFKYKNIEDTLKNLMND